MVKETVKPVEEEVVDTTDYTQFLDIEICHTLTIKPVFRAMVEMINVSKGEANIRRRLDVLFESNSTQVLNKNVNRGTGFASKSITADYLSTRVLLKMANHCERITTKIDGVTSTGIANSKIAIKGIDENGKEFTRIIIAKTVKLVYHTETLAATIDVVPQIENKLTKGYIMGNLEGLALCINLASEEIVNKIRMVQDNLSVKESKEFFKMLSKEVTMRDIDALVFNSPIDIEENHTICTYDDLADDLAKDYIKYATPSSEDDDRQTKLSSIIKTYLIND